MNRTEAIEYLTRCNHWCNGTNYRSTPEDCPTCKGTGIDDARCDSVHGTWSSQCAEVAYKVARIKAQQSADNELLTDLSLQEIMHMVVNNHEDIAETINGYATGLAGVSDAALEGNGDRIPRLPTLGRARLWAI